MRIAVVGATGVLGRHLLPRLAAAGHQVRATYRKPEDAVRLVRLGYEAVAADILDAASLEPVVADCDAALHIATRIPPPSPDADWSVNDSIRRDGTMNLISACTAAGCRRYVQQSVAMIVNTADDRPQTEDDPVSGAGPLASSLDAERLVQESGLDWRIVRGGIFYGPGTGMDGVWRSAARDGSLTVPGDGSAWISLIHVADMAAAVQTVVEADARLRTWHAVDSQPVPVGTLFDGIAALENADTPKRGGPAGLPSFRVSNTRINSELGWVPRYPNWRCGFTL